jgi:hypothetical protein
MKLAVGLPPSLSNETAMSLRYFTTHSRDYLPRIPSLTLLFALAERYSCQMRPVSLDDASALGELDFPLL